MGRKEFNILIKETREPNRLGNGPKTRENENRLVLGKYTCNLK
jgi:hypothetical protein